MEGSTKRPARKLKSASQAEILRSHQRDDDFVKELREKFLDMITIFGRKNIPHLVYSDIPFRLVYFFFTSGLGNQTLGEEYTGIVQANLDARKVPSLTTRVLGAILECFGEQGLLFMLKRLQRSINNPSSELTPSAVNFLNLLLSKSITLVPTMILIHKGLFYLYGRYYDISKRLMGIDYAKVYGRRPTDDISWWLRLLGFATLAQCALQLWQSRNELEYDNKAIIADEAHAKMTCQLCLSKLPTTTTPCGHLFCWYCISDWLSKKPQCPVCREYVAPSRIVYLMNL